jgi:adenosylhomocysteine nucleosidase
MLLLLSAMPEEIEALRPSLQDACAVEGAGAARAAWQGRLHGHPVTVAFSRWGKVAAAATAAHLIARLQPTQVIFTGIAGALDPTLQVGDLVVARDLYQHDLDASPFFAPTVVPLLDRSAMPTDAVLSQALLRAAQQWHAAAQASAAADRTAADLPRRIVHGDIATGDQVIGTAVAREIVRRRVPRAVCVEMEGAAVAQVCHEFGVPFACLRLISDSADECIAPDEIYALARRSGRITTEILARWRSTQQRHEGGAQQRDQHGADEIDEQP